LINPYAYFDCLSIGANFKRPLGNVAFAELHLFAYFACLLSLYRKNPVSDWGYMYAGTKEGTPFSPEIAEAMPKLIQNGLFTEHEGFLELTKSGYSEYETLLQMSQMKEREIYLQSSCSCVLALPVGIVRSALINEPELRRSTLSTTRRLLENPGLEILYEHFLALESAVGTDVQDLMMSAIIWLTYLSEQSNNLTKTEEAGFYEPPRC
jgi:hypothetical protein